MNCFEWSLTWFLSLTKSYFLCSSVFNSEVSFRQIFLDPWNLKFGLDIRWKIFLKSCCRIFYWVLVRVVGIKLQTWQVSWVLEPSLKFRVPRSRIPRTTRVSSLRSHIYSIGSWVTGLIREMDHEPWVTKGSWFWIFLFGYVCKK